MFFIFFFNDTATTEIYTLSLHDALPIFNISRQTRGGRHVDSRRHRRVQERLGSAPQSGTGRQEGRSEEHTSELQSRQYLVCRLLLEKKKKSSQLNVRRL